MVPLSSPLPLLTREHRGFLYLTLDHASVTPISLCLACIIDIQQHRLLQSVHHIAVHSCILLLCLQDITLRINLQHTQSASI